MDLIAVAGRIEALKTLLYLQPEQRTGSRWSGTPLMFAAAQAADDGAAVKVLVDNNLDTQDMRGNTAVLWAALNGHLQNVISLVQMGAEGKGRATVILD